MTEDLRRELLKIGDTITLARQFHEHRDEMNAANHAAVEVRHSPLCAKLRIAEAALRQLLQETSS